MAIQIIGAGASVAEVGAFAAKGVHTVNKPQDYGSLGHYQVAAATGVMAAGLAANAPIFSARWGDATRFALIQKLSITGLRTTLAFAVGVITLEAFIARAFTVSDSSGTAITLTGDNQNMRTSMGASLFTDMRIASTATLTAGTRTLDTQAVGMIVTHSSAGTGGATPIIGSQFLPITDLFECDVTDGEHPIVLAQNEGIIVRATVPATGTWNIGIQMKWAEVAAF